MRKRDAFAMIRQLGFPSIFITQSVAETKQKDLLKCLGKTVHNKEYTSEEIDTMDYRTKCELIQGHSPTLVCFCENHFNIFMKDVVNSKCKPIGEVTDYFWRKEFASRGAIHVHWFAYLNDAPVYGESSNEYVADYYDKIISCYFDVPEKHKEYINYQIHRHSKYCHLGKLKHCRFSFPQPPMPYTCILEPFLAEDIERENEGEQSWSHIHNYLESYGLGTNVTESFSDMLIQLDMTMDQYINGVCSSITCHKFSPRENLVKLE